MTNLYAGSILRVDLSDGFISTEPTRNYATKFLGGRGINIKLLYDGMPAEIEPLDSRSLLIFGAGPLCGTPVPAGRTDVTGRSPETNFLGSSNFGGYFGAELKFAGYDHIVITGRAGNPVYLWIYNDRVEIRSAEHLWGKDTYETQHLIRSQLDPDAKIACIGQAGENLVRFATIQHGLGHAAGRTGMGTIMGSKNLKAVVVRGTRGISLANAEAYLSISQKLETEMKNHPGIQFLQKHGLSPMVKITGGVPDASPHPLIDRYKAVRTGCYGCPAQCMDRFPVGAKGGGVISCELWAQSFEVVGNEDQDTGLEAALLAQRFGIDIVSSMTIISWLMGLYHKGILTAQDTDGIPMEWGSPEAMIGMLREIVFREGVGDILAEGMLNASEKFGKKSLNYATVVKGHPTEYTWEAFKKGWTLAMAVGIRGDSMKSMPLAFEPAATAYAGVYTKQVEAKYEKEIQEEAEKISGSQKAMDPLETDGKPELVVYSEDSITINDCMSACKLSGTGLHGLRTWNDEYRAKLFSAGTGIETSVDDLRKIAKRVRNLERAYNVRLGMTRELDTLPKRFLEKPIKYLQNNYAPVTQDALEKMKDRYYELRGWDVLTGIPTRETLETFGLTDVARDLDRMGRLPKTAEEKN